MTFTVLLCGWTVAKELMYSKWMATYANFYDKVKTLGRNTNYFKAMSERFRLKPGTQQTLSELWSMRLMVVQTGLFLLFEKFLLGGVDHGLMHAGMEMTTAWLSGIILLKMLSTTTVLSNAGFGNFVTKGLYGYNGRITRTRLFDIFAPARDVLTNVYPNKWMGPVYYGGKLGIWAISKFVGYKSYTDFVLATDKANRNAALNATTNELNRLGDASEFFYSKSTYGYVQGIYNDDENETLNRIVVAIDDIDLSDVSSTQKSTDKSFKLELPESIWTLLSEGKKQGEKVNLYTYDSDGDPVAVEYNVNSKEIAIPKGAVDSYVTLFTNVKDVVNNGEEAYAQGLHSAVVSAYGKFGDPTLSAEKRASTEMLLFVGETSTLNRLLKVVGSLSDMDLLTLDTMLRDLAPEFTNYEGIISQVVTAIEQQLIDRNVTVDSFMKDNEKTLKDETTEKGEQVSKVFKSYDNFADKVDKISINLSKYEESQNEVLTRDAIERFLTQNFSDDADIAKKMMTLKGTETEELLKLGLLAFAKAQADKTITVDKMQKIEVSFISLLIQPKTASVLDKISVSEDVVDGFSVPEMKKIVESAKTFSDALNKLDEVKISKATELQNAIEDFNDYKILEKLQLDNPDFGKAYELFKSDCRDAFEAGKSE